MYRPSMEDTQKALIMTDPNTSTSIVSYFYNTRYTVGCRFDMRLFPFDTQKCTFSFVSWTYDITMLDYVPTSDSVTLELYQPSDIWTVKSFNITSSLFAYECCPSPYRVVHAHLVIKRKSLYYVFNLIIPTIVINLLSSFSLFASPGTPSNMHDKLQIGITTLLSYCILLLSVSDQMPKGSTSVPLLGK